MSKRKLPITVFNETMKMYSKYPRPVSMGELALHMSSQLTLALKNMKARQFQDASYDLAHLAAFILQVAENIGGRKKVSRDNI